jgi:hypothetical protein
MFREVTGVTAMPEPLVELPSCRLKMRRMTARCKLLGDG